jgi:hypothetical protein
MYFPKDTTIEKNYQVPKTIHLIWVGGEINKNYLENIDILASILKDSQYTLKIWTDAGSRNSNGKSFGDIPGLIVENIEDLLGRFLSDKNENFTYQEKLCYVKCILFEYFRPANYAAIADFLRIEILRQEGGLYMDLDNIALKALQNAQKHAFGKILKTLQQKIPKYFKIPRSLSQVGISAYAGNNGIIAATVDHPVLILCQKEMIKKQTQHDIISEIEFSDERKRFLQSEHAWRILKKSPAIVPYTHIGHPTETGNCDEYNDWLRVEYNEGVLMPAFRKLTIDIGPECLNDCIDEWYDFLPEQGTEVPDDVLCNNFLWRSLSQIFDFDQHDGTWLPKSPLPFDADLIENAVTAFEVGVDPLIFSDLQERMTTQTLPSLVEDIQMSSKPCHLDTAVRGSVAKI